MLMELPSLADLYTMRVGFRATLRGRWNCMEFLKGGEFLSRRYNRSNLISAKRFCVFGGKALAITKFHTIQRAY